MSDTYIFGTEPGGLRTRGEIKIFICFVLEAAGCAMTADQISDVTQICGAANYFEVGQSINELTETGGIAAEPSEDGVQLLSLTDEGRSCVKTLQNEIPLSLRDKADFAAKKIAARARAQRENNVEISKTLGGYNVTCEVNDRDLMLMKLTLLVSDFGAASLIKEKFLNDPAGFYRSVVDTIVVEEETNQNHES